MNHLSGGIRDDGEGKRKKDGTNALLNSNLLLLTRTFIGVWQLANCSPSWP